jgi:phosphoglycolate phosphatase
VTRFAVGFDLDMTLIDSRPGVVASFDALNAELGTTIDGEALAARLGPTLESEMAHYFPESEIPRVCDRYRAIYAELGPVGCSLLPGAREAVDAVRAAGGLAVVVTAKYEPNAHRCLDAVGIAVDHVHGWLHGAEKGVVLAEHGALAYVGDTPPDMEAAHRAGAAAIAVPSGPWSAAELQAAGADVVLSSLEEFPAWLRALRSA